MADLPIFQYKKDLMDAIQNYQFLVIMGDTGSGKTTQLPQYLLESNMYKRRIAITQPRRIAAISAAKRVAFEQRATLGSSLVGYSIRFEKKCRADTRLVFMTDGMLLRESVSDPSFSRYDVIVLDEAHERSLETDILFGLLKRACKKRSELRVIIMSATLDAEKFSEFFDNCPCFSIPGRMFDVDVFWARPLTVSVARSSFVDRSVETVLHIHEHQEPGDVLVFLTGQSEIELACKKLKQLYDQKNPDTPQFHKLLIYPIYASLDTLDQKAIFEKTPTGHRKVVFATNIAQTSITIPGIRYVIDSGFVKQKIYDSKTGVDALLTVPISQAAATQRAGRAGRTQEGQVYRLYSREAFYDMEINTTPEIQRSSLLGTVLSLKQIGIIDIVGFEFIDPPDPALVYAAEVQLFRLGAIESDGRLTEKGRQMSHFPVSPLLANVLIQSSVKYNCTLEVLPIVSMLSVEDAFMVPRSLDMVDAAREAHSLFYHKSSDHITQYNLFEAWRAAGRSNEWCHEYFIRSRSMKAAEEVYYQLIDLLKSLNLSIESLQKENSKIKLGSRTSSTIIKCFCESFFIHTAKRHGRSKIWFPWAARQFEDTADELKNAPLGLNSSSCLIPMLEKKNLEWVVYHDLHYINRPLMSCVSVVEFDMVNELIQMHLKLKLNRKSVEDDHFDRIINENIDNVNIAGDEDDSGSLDEQPTAAVEHAVFVEKVHERIDAVAAVEILQEVTVVAGTRTNSKSATVLGGKKMDSKSATETQSANNAPATDNAVECVNTTTINSTEPVLPEDPTKHSQTLSKAQLARERYMKRKRN